MLVEYQYASEPEHYGYHHCSEEFAYRVRQSLAGGDLDVLVPHPAGYPVKTLAHLFLCEEGLDDTQTSEGFLDLTHCVAPESLGFK